MRTIYLYKVQGLVKVFLPLYLFAFMPLLMSCDYIEEADRLIAVDDAHTDTPVDTLKSAVRNVLLEDFTGQRCSNCPTGTEVIEQLQEIYGERLIAVGIHGGPLGFKGTATVLGLATDVGDEYYSHWQLEYQPVGLVDRHGAVNYTEWAKAVRDEMAIPSDVKMEVKAALNGSQFRQWAPTATPTANCRCGCWRTALPPLRPCLTAPTTATTSTTTCCAHLSTASGAKPSPLAKVSKSRGAINRLSMKRGMRPISVSWPLSTTIAASCRRRNDK